MPSRAELNLRAFAVGLDPAAIYNDSKLEQRILFLEKNSYAVTGTKPTTTLTQGGVATDGDTQTIGPITYTLKTALTGVLATTTLTSTGTIPNDNDFVRIGDYKYIFKTTLDTTNLYLNLSGETYGVQVLINGSAANALTNLKKAILANGTPATDYTSLTTLVANPKVNATTITSTTLLLVAFRAGSPSYVGYKIPSLVSPSGTTLSFTGTFFGSGVDPVANQVLIGAAATNTLDNIKDAINGTVVSGSIDVIYSQPTKRHPFVTAGAKNATTLVIASTDTNTVGALATTSAVTANGAFTGTTLASGVAGMIAITGDGVTDSVAGVAGGANTAL